MAVPPTIDYGPFTTLGAELNANEEGVSTLAETLGITSPKDECECAPFGSNFWVRSAAMRTLLAKAWKYEDFPEEPMPVDSTISHAIERIYPVVAQNEVFYTSWIMLDEYERIYLNNVTGVLRKLNASLYEELGVHNATNMRMVVEKHFENVKWMTEGRRINIKKLMVLELKKMLFFW